MPRESRLWQPCLWLRNFKLNSPHVRTRISAGRTGRLTPPQAGISDLKRGPQTFKVRPARNAEDAQSDSDIHGRARLSDACRTASKLDAIDAHAHPSPGTRKHSLLFSASVPSEARCDRIEIGWTASKLDALTLIESR